MCPPSPLARFARAGAFSPSPPSTSMSSSARPLGRPGLSAASRGFPWVTAAQTERDRIEPAHSQRTLATGPEPILKRRWSRFGCPETPGLNDAGCPIGGESCHRQTCPSYAFGGPTALQRVNNEPIAYRVCGRPYSLVLQLLDPCGAARANHAALRGQYALARPVSLDMCPRSR